jgi:hypothetical protein
MCDARREHNGAMMLPANEEKPQSSLHLAQELRTIGHVLETHGVTSFTVKAEEDGYHIRFPGSQDRNKTKPPQKKLPDRVLRNREFLGILLNAKKQEEIHYKFSDIVLLNSEQKSLRIGSVETDRNLSQCLRSVGDYLSRKHAKGFTLSWSENTLSISYRSPDGVEERDRLTVKTVSALSKQACGKRLTRK